MRKFLTLSFALCLGLSTILQAQEKTVTGRVLSSEDNLGIPGASIIVKGTTLGTTTDFEGGYSIKVPSSNSVLVFSFVGMKTTELVVGDQSVIDITLSPETFGLEELVVVGYGIQKKREVTGAISQVKGDEIASLATPSFESQLAGRTAGVQVTSGSGVLGEAPRIRVRGIGSISHSTYPLVVVDGIPVFTENQGGYASSNAMGDINPSDIESIEILKDGSATAIYGSRAANGVMLITTKKGKSGKPRLSYNNYVGFASPVKMFDLLNADEFITIANEKYSNRGWAEAAVASEFDTDWQAAVLRQNAFQQDHNISLSGSGELTNYYVSLGYASQDGVTKPNDMTRFSFRANVDQKVTKWLTVGANAGITRSQYTGLNTGQNSLSGNIFNAIRQLPNTPIYNHAHPSGYNIDFVNDNLVGRWNNTESIGDNLPNIVYVIDYNTHESKVFRTIANTFATASILPTLTLTTQVSVDNSSTEGFRYWNPFHGDGASVNGRINNNYRQATRWNWQNVLSYNETFGGVHNLGLTLVNEFQQQRVNRFWAMGTNMSSEYFRHGIISGSLANQFIGGGINETGFISYAGRLNYNYKGKYFLQASLRRDGISSLPKENRFGMFPGVSAGWTISQEDFFQGISFISDLKLRASYAQVGNVAIGDIMAQVGNINVGDNVGNRFEENSYPYMGLYEPILYGNSLAIGYSQFSNPLLKWETSKKYDVGFDVMFLAGKYKLTFDYYLNDQDGLILNAPTPPSVGIPNNQIARNSGRLSNWGYEFSFEANLLRSKDFSLSLDGNLTLARNEIKSLVDGQDITLAYTIIREGESIRSIYGFDYVGVNAANGNPIYRKANGELVQGNIPTGSYRVYDPANPADISQTSSLTASDKKIFGPSLPTYFGGFGARSRYKNFDLAVMFRFSGGNYIMNRTRDDLNGQAFTNNGREILGRWQSPENPGDGWTPRLWASGTNFINLNGQTNGRFVEKGDFLKLQNLIIGYNLPKETATRLGLENLRIFAQGQELFMITNYSGLDPEMEVNGVDWNITPRQRVITLGVNLTL